MSSDRPVSKVQLSSEFDAKIEENKAAELARTNTYLMSQPLDVDSLTVPVQLTPDALEEQYAAFYEDMREDVQQIVGAGEADSLGTIADMQAVTRQGNFMDTQKRAAALRNNSRSRRLVHSAMRRRSHGVDGGFYDRRVVRQITDNLQAAKDYQ